MNYSKAITTLIVSGIIVCITTACIVGIQMKSDQRVTYSDELCNGICVSNVQGNSKKPGKLKKIDFPPGAFLPNKTFPRVVLAPFHYKTAIRDPWIPTENPWIPEIDRDMPFDGDYQLTLKLSQFGQGICKGALVHEQTILTTADWNGSDIF